MLERATILGLKTETTQGTPVTLAATDFLLAEDLDVTPTVELNERNQYRTTIGSISPIPGKTMYDISFKTAAKASGTAGTAYAPLGALFVCCGMTETIVPVISVTYDLVSAPVANFEGPGKSATVITNWDGVQIRIAGVVGDWTQPLSAGKTSLIEFTGKGVYEGPTDTTAPSTTYLAEKEVIVESASLSLQGFSTVVAENLTIGLGNTIAEIPDINSAQGLKGFLITGRQAAGSVDPEYELVATHDFIGKMKSGAEASTSVVLGATAGNIITYTMPKTQYTGFKFGARAGIRTTDIPLRYNEDTGDDEVKVAMT